MKNSLRLLETGNLDHADVGVTLEKLCQDMLHDFGATAVGPNDDEAWLSCSRIVRLLFSSENSSRISKRSCSLSSDLCYALLLSVFPKENWADSISNVLQRWGIHEGQDRIFARCFAMAFLALKYMNSTILENEEAPKCLAILDISCLCLQIATSEIREFNGTIGRKKMKEILIAALSDYEQECASLEGKTNSLSLGKVHFLRLNYYATCSRQYARLERPVGNRQKQGTLENWI